MTKKVFVLFLIFSTVLFLTSCASKRRVAYDEDIDTAEEEQPFIPVEEDIRVQDIDDEADIAMDEFVPATGYLEDVFFLIDRYNLGEEAKRILDRNIRWLRDNPRVNVLIEGHCCDIGTVEYNYALGDRRANSVRDYLIMNGIEPGRISTVSYGKMKPFVMGTQESQRAKNRRAHFKIQRY